ncbi:MAG: hisS [Paenibacillus sp.]|nr:hisS [Paenibacillus sp.]
MQNVKGTYDFFGAEQAVRKKVQSMLREVFELYDFDEMESTILYERDVLTSKYAGGEEIVKEMYQLTDQGNRELALRYDLTIPFAKVIALHPGIELPFKRYEIGKVFRDGPVKRGRLREFLQCDVDVVGIEGPEAEAELMLMATEGFKRLELPVVLRWNNRRFLGELLQATGIAADQTGTVMLTLDKLAKIGKAAVAEELRSKGLDDPTVAAISELIGMEAPDLARLSEKYGVGSTVGAREVSALQQLIAGLGLEEVCRFDPFLSRGLSFYTGTVYEIFDASGMFTSSLGAGGRYDRMIGKLLGQDELCYPTVGLSFGLESIMELIGSRPAEPAEPAVVIIPIGDAAVSESLRAASRLRASGIRTRVEVGKRKLKKALAAASAKRIRYVILIGDDELACGQIRVKDMEIQTEVSGPREQMLQQLVELAKRSMSDSFREGGL